MAENDADEMDDESVEHPFPGTFDVDDGPSRSASSLDAWKTPIRA